VCCGFSWCTRASAAWHQRCVTLLAVIGERQAPYFAFLDVQVALERLAVSSSLGLPCDLKFKSTRSRSSLFSTMIVMRAFVLTCLPLTHPSLSPLTFKAKDGSAVLVALALTFVFLPLATSDLCNSGLGKVFDSTGAVFVAPCSTSYMSTCSQLHCQPDFQVR
jgi:hypothetical protein